MFPAIFTTTTVPGAIQPLPNGSAVSPEVPVWSLNSDGTYSISGASSGNWIVPTTSQVAAFYEVKVDVTSGSFETGSPTGEWLDMSTTRGWGKNVFGTVEFTVSFRVKTNGIVRSVQAGKTLTSSAP